MREIKFRAWRSTGLNKGTMVRVKSLQFNDFVNVNGGEPLELMQYTGLKDKNGKEIYEGDIIICMDGMLVVEYISGKSDGGAIYSGFEFKHPTRGRWRGVGDVEVIGNIYENKDLLK